MWWWILLLLFIKRYLQFCLYNPFPSSRGMWPNSRECLRIGKFAAMYPPSKATFTIPLRKKEIEDKRPQPESCKTI